MEFEIVGFRKRNDGKDLTVRKKRTFARILIRKKQVMNKYCPEQFEIIGITDRQNSSGIRNKKYTLEDSSNYNDLNAGGVLKLSNGNYKSIYMRILVKNKHPQKSRCLNKE